jgi:hypothetical protein
MSSSAESYEDIERTIVLCSEKFNALHHGIPPSETEFFMVRNEVHWLSENIIKLNLLKWKGMTTHVILQKIPREGAENFERNVFLSYVSPLFQYLAGADFFMHQRGIPFSPIPSKMKFIGSCAFMKCPEHIHSLRRAYELFFHQQPQNQHKQSTLDDILLRQIVNKLTLARFMRTKASFTASFGISAARNIICQTRYPHTEEFIINSDAGKIVPTFVVPKGGSESSIRSSPNVRRIIGPNNEYRNEMVLSLSAAINAFIVNGYEPLCAIE